jgi:hypothetical protein
MDLDDLAQPLHETSYGNGTLGKASLQNNPPIRERSRGVVGHHRPKPPPREDHGARLIEGFGKLEQVGDRGDRLQLSAEPEREDGVVPAVERRRPLGGPRTKQVRKLGDGAGDLGEEAAVPRPATPSIEPRHFPGNPSLERRSPLATRRLLIRPQIPRQPLRWSFAHPSPAGSLPRSPSSARCSRLRAS